jgi:ectoine hydroxylase-related dioxygenase (phytanoyl-CoA dioxygenase family)
MSNLSESFDRDTFDRQGFSVVRQAFDASRIAALQAAVDAVIERGLAGQIELEWLDRDGGVPQRISHLLHPDKYAAVFGAWLAEDLAGPLEAILGAPARHSLFGMLSGGAGQTYRQRWHRDLARPGDPGEEDLLHRFHGICVQFNAPLLAGDRFLEVVPSSHRRASLPAEIEAAAAEGGQMPGGVALALEPGDIVYYNANLWHRGWNPKGMQRRTLHCAFWRASYPVMQHEYGQADALGEVDHLAALPPRARFLVQRYLDACPAGPPSSLLDL